MFIAAMAIGSMGGCGVMRDGYVHRGVRGIVLVANHPLRDAPGVAEVRMEVPAGASRADAFRMFLVHVRGLGGESVAGVVGEFVDDARGQQRLCRVAFSPRGDAQARTEVVTVDEPAGRPSGAMVSERVHKCTRKQVTEWRYETVYENEYDYVTRRTVRRSRQKYKPHTVYKDVCGMETVHVWDEDAGYRRPARTRSETVTTRWTDWTLEMSEPECGPVAPGAVGVMTGRALFWPEIPDATMRLADVSVPTRIDCTPCERVEAWRVACVAGQGGEADEAPPSTSPLAPGASERIGLGTMDDVETGEAWLRRFIGRTVVVTMKDGATVEGAVLRVQAARCDLRTRDGASIGVDLLEALEAEVGGTIGVAVETAAAPRCATPPVEVCPDLCPAPGVAGIPEQPAPLDVASIEADRTPEPTHIEIDGLDAAQRAETLLQRHVGATVTVVLRTGERITGNVSRVHAGRVTVHAESGQRHVVVLEEAHALYLGDEATPAVPSEAPGAHP